MRIILDTNVLVAGLAARRDDAPTRRILGALRRGAHRSVVSKALLEEYRAVLGRPQVARWTGLQPPLEARLIAEIAGFSTLVEPLPAALAPPDADSWWFASTKGSGLSTAPLA